MATLPKFHSRTGSLVTLSNDGQTAQRSHPTQEFNNGVVLSAEALKDDKIFEVKIDKKVVFIGESISHVHCDIRAGHFVH